MPLAPAPRKKRPLLLPAGKLPNLPAGEIGQPHLFERAVGNFLFRGAGSPKPTEPAVSAHQHHIAHGDGELPIDTLPLRHIANQVPLLGVGLPVDFHMPTRQRREPENRLDERRLAGAVGAHHADQSPLGGLKVNVPQHGPAPIGHREIVNFKGDFGHAIRRLTVPRFRPAH